MEHRSAVIGIFFPFALEILRGDLPAVEVSLESEVLQSTTVTHVSSWEMLLISGMSAEAFGTMSLRGKVNNSATCMGSLMPVLSMTK